MFNSLKQILVLFSKGERWQFAGVVTAMLAMGILQTAGIGVVLPFVSLLSNPQHIHENAWLSWIYNALDFQSTSGFLIALGVFLLVVLVMSNALTAFTIWIMTHFSWGVQKRVSIRLLSGYLDQPYERFLNRNSAETGKNILIESQQFANGVLMPALKAIAYGITAFLIVALLFWLNPLVASATTTIFCAAYLAVYLVVRRKLVEIGGRRLRANTARFQAVNEAFGSVKEVKILGRETAFLQRYNPEAHIYAVAMADSAVFGQIPKFVVEGLAFSLVMAAMLYLLASGSDIKDALPVASAFLVGGYRLLPALQQIYQGVAQWRSNQPVVDTLVSDLQEAERSRLSKGIMSKLPVKNGDCERLQFLDSICLTGVNYLYPFSESPSLVNLDITIEKNSFVALTGTTGAGKTTLADMILGLIHPTSGKIVVDETSITVGNAAKWQRNLGYVPQDIYLADTSIRSNIAYGIPDSEIDDSAVERAARIANVHDFIVTKLPAGYQSLVGERGVRLSGGQKQRIGIARALYHDPQVVVLDEATSALDTRTERRIVDELDKMRGGRTLIVIAHRLSTVRQAQKIFLLHEGKVVSEGTYDELLERNEEFRRLAQGVHSAEKSAAGNQALSVVE